MLGLSLARAKLAEWKISAPLSMMDPPQRPTQSELDVMRGRSKLLALGNGPVVGGKKKKKRKRDLAGVEEDQQEEDEEVDVPKASKAAKPGSASRGLRACWMPS